MLRLTAEAKSASANGNHTVFPPGERPARHLRTLYAELDDGCGQSVTTVPVATSAKRRASSAIAACDDAGALCATKSEGPALASGRPGKTLGIRRSCRRVAQTVARATAISR